MRKEKSVTGTVTHIDDFGSIVTMWVKTKRRKRPLVTVNFDRRMFGHMWEQENGAIEGRHVQVTGEFGDQRVEFLD